MTRLIHRPSGIGHPYAASADQRVPVHPAIGTSVTLGVVLEDAPETARVTCEWDDGAETVVLEATPGSASPADAAALAGGDGHLAEAQAGQLEADGAWHVQSPVLEAGRRVRYRFLAEDASTEWFEVSAGEWTTTAPSAGADITVGGVPASEHPLVDAESVQWWTDADAARRVRFSFVLDASEHVVGFGERFDAVDQRGRRLDAVVFEQYKSQGATGRTYLPMPFAHVVGGEGWGFHVRTSRRTWYDVGASTPDRLVIEALLGKQPALDVAVYSGTPAEVLRAFGDEVGRAEELPDWVLRLWASGNEWNSQQLVMEQMDAHRDLEVPVGAVVIEAWSDEEGITIFRDAQYEITADGAPHTGADFTYPADGAWPDPKGMIDELHARGVKVILWQIPLLKTEHDLGTSVPSDAQVLQDGRAMAAAGHAVREADGSPYHNRGWWFPQSLMADLSTEEGREWWTAHRQYLVEDLDVDGFKTDGGEHAWGDELRYADGRRGDEGNNLNAVHYARAFGDLLRRNGKAPVTFSRAGFTGSQAHGIHWAGDENSTWEAFRWSMNAGITASACGIVYWGWDLAGFSGPVPGPELYLRGVAAATFCPIMQYHSEFNHHKRPLRDRTPWYVAEAHDDPHVVEVFREYVQLRERLVPYLAEQAGRAIATGTPLMRGLFVDHAHDETIWEHADQYQLGDDLLIHPVTEEGASTWTTYLPAGDWVDAWTGELAAGTVHGEGLLVTREVPREVIPVYVRAAAWPELASVFAPAQAS
ncbi:TIM-barrel domain-containing protein [Brachybacterium vulturis]|uniref:glycoside hydrolase family 31 protein n=1 Tax=Brachybacterium vulturis TaxID=2017484 RepID=UPI003734FA73